MNEKQHFLSKVKKTETCWLWSGALTTRGYGTFSFECRRTQAHRASFVLFKGKIPQGKLVCHSCDVPSCVNPKHLWLGTAQDNTTDMMKKGRGRFLKGEETTQATITNKQAAEIWKLRAEKGLLNREIAEKLNVSCSVVQNVVSGRSWQKQKVVLTVEAAKTLSLKKALRRSPRDLKDISKIKKLREQGLTYREIGEKFSLDQSAIYKICKGLRWKM